MDLVILDCSQYIYAGYYGNKRGFKVTRGVRQHEGEWIARDFEAHGAIFLFKEIQRLASSNNIIMPVFDRTPNIKRKMWKEIFGEDGDGYKGKRNPNPVEAAKIRFNKDFAEACCRKMGFSVQAAEDYEADDIIYTLVQMYHDDFAHIRIHNKDGDLFFLVDDVVSIEPVGDKGRYITVENYEYSVMNKETIVYNTIGLNRLLRTDSSDNIEGIGSWWADYISEYVTLDNVRSCGDLEVCREILRKVVKAHSESPNSERVLSTFNLMSPLLVPTDLIDDNEHRVNWTMLQSYYCDNLRPTSDNWGCEDIVEQFIERWEDEILC